MAGEIIEIRNGEVVNVEQGAQINRANPSGADTDERVIEMWLAGKAELTRKKYGQVVRDFFNWARVGIGHVTLSDLHYFKAMLEDEGFAVNTVAVKLYALKSLLTYANKIGYCPFNVGKALTEIETEDKLAQRILTENEVRKILVLEEDRRNSLILHTLYITGCRVSELCNIRWGDFQERPEQRTGQVTFPKTKGKKPRTILLPERFWAELSTYYAEKDGAKPSDYAFTSYNTGSQLDPKMIWRIVHAAAQRAGIPGNVSPHWLRHSHASHALDRGAGIHLVKDTLGHKNLAITGRYLHARPTDSSARYLGF